MAENRFPGDPMADVRDLQRTVEDEQATQRRQPLVEASAGWIFTDRATPTTPTSGKTHIYSQGGRLWAASSAGAVPLLLPDDPLQTPVSGMPGLSTPNAWPGTYTPGTGEAVQDDLVMMRDKIHEIIDSLTR